MKSYDIARCSTLIGGECASAWCQLQTFQAVRPICTVVDVRAESWIRIEGWRCAPYDKHSPGPA